MATLTDVPAAVTSVNDCSKGLTVALDAMLTMMDLD